MKKLYFSLIAALFSAATTYANISVSVTPFASSPAYPRSITRFATITVTNSGPTDANIGNIQVEHTGTDDNIGQIILLRDDGLLGWSSAFNINHTATLNGYPVDAHSARTWTIALQMPADMTSYDGAIIDLSLIGLDATTELGVLMNIPIDSSFPKTLGTHACSTNEGDIGDLKIKGQSFLGDTNVLADGQQHIIGGFDIIASNQGMTIPFLNLKIQSDGDNVGLITNVVLIDLSGAILAGPVDVGIGEWSTNSYGYAFFNGTILFPQGTNHVAVVANVNNDFHGKLRCEMQPNENIVVHGSVYDTDFMYAGTTVFGPTMTVVHPINGASIKQFTFFDYDKRFIN